MLTSMPLAPQETRTYFVTFVGAGRRRRFQVHENAKLMLDVIQTNRTSERLQVHAFVLLITPSPEGSLEKA
jgi:putative transposase